MMALILTLMMGQTPIPGMATIAQGSSSAIENPREVVARSHAEWETLWKSHAGLQIVPAVDFSTSMVAAVFLGTRPTGGFSVAITGARREGEALVVEYIDRVPGADAIVTQVLTSPFQIITLPRFNGQVRFRKAAAGNRP